MSCAHEEDEALAAFAVREVLCEALAWGATYGPAIPGHQWDDMRDKMVEQFAARLDAAPAEPTDSERLEVAFDTLQWLFREKGADVAVVVARELLRRAGVDDERAAQVAPLPRVPDAAVAEFRRFVAGNVGTAAPLTSRQARRVLEAWQARATQQSSTGDEQEAWKRAGGTGLGHAAHKLERQQQFTGEPS